MRAYPVRLSSGTCGSRIYSAPIAAGDLNDIPPFTFDAARGADLMGSQAGAELLLARLVKAWASEGHKIDAWIVKLSLRTIEDRGVKQAWAVRTDLVNGMPSGLGRAKWEAKFGGEF